ncbi:aminoglycoside phosphotransferase [Microbispora sp. NBC_01389]|uniref:aminoglycoside phosphotransferase n=1 Tax=Microbispora sp. NBC_01389 TaxID=2903584 RepID=UPI003250158A
MTSHGQACSGQHAFLRRVLAEGARRLGAAPVGDARFGWRDRTIGTAAMAGGGLFWVRATAEHHDSAHGEAWTGNADAAEIAGVPKPELVARVEWEEPPVVVYAELLGYVPDAACSPTPELTAELALPDAWWAGLHAALAAVAAHPTTRGTGDPASYLRDLERLYGRALDLPAPELRTEHTDLHWANLTQPRPYLLDWEYWGRAPAGYGPALLYCHALLVPATADRVQQVFADVLDTPSGRVAQLAAAAHILDRAHRTGDYPDLRRPVREHAHRLLAAASRSGAC